MERQDELKTKHTHTCFHPLLLNKPLKCNLNLNQKEMSGRGEREREREGENVQRY